MIITTVHFGENKENTQKIDFLLLPKIGEIIAYGAAKETEHYVVKDIVHSVDIKTNKASQTVEIYASKLECSEN